MPHRVVSFERHPRETAWEADVFIEQPSLSGPV
jgi:hypothetical protein